MKDVYLVYEGVVSPDLCNKIVDSFDEKNYEEGRVGDGPVGIIDKQIRDADRQWAPRLSLVECILARFITKANAEAAWNFEITEPEQVQIGRYREGQFYDQHMDCNVKGSDVVAIGTEVGVIVPMLTQRKISASLLLNDESEYDGGDLRILQETVRVKKQGTIIVFPSFIAHQVTPVTRGVRYSAVCWMAGPKWK